MKVGLRTMSSNVTVRLNGLGMGLNISQINAVLNLEDKSVSIQRRWLVSFFQLQPPELTRALLTRYIQADAIMARVSAGTFQEDIHSRLINTLASAKRCYAFTNPAFSSLGT